MKLRVINKTDRSAFVATEDGAHEALYVWDAHNKYWAFETNVFGDLEAHLEAELGSEKAKDEAIDATLA